MKTLGKLMIVTEELVAKEPYGFRVATHKIHQKGRMTDLDMVNLYHKLKRDPRYKAVTMYREVISYNVVDMTHYYQHPNHMEEVASWH